MPAGEKIEVTPLVGLRDVFEKDLRVAARRHLHSGLPLCAACREFLVGKTHVEPACGHVQLYQQSRCRACGSEALVHRAASGRGRVHSFSVVHRAPGPAFKDDTPYAVLLVDLEEGPRMISTYTGGSPDEVTFDMNVMLVCERIDDSTTLPRFRRA